MDVCKRVLLFEIQMGCAIVLEECVQKLLREGVTLEAKNQIAQLEERCKEAVSSNLTLVL